MCTALTATMQTSVSKSIPNDLEDALGNLCGSVIHKGQMFLSTGKTLQVVRIPLSQDEGKPLEVIVPPSTNDVEHRGENSNVQ